MFVDELKIRAKAGKGGDGVVLWRHEKGKEFSGPSGGNGGKGGDVYISAVRDIGLLSRYRNIKKFAAPDGGRGMRNSKSGKDGEDLDIPLPIGSIVTNLKTGKKFSIENQGERILILNGGNGGYGNEHFKGSKNVRPKEFTLGKIGEEEDFFIELELVVDAGLIGLPNAGKSSLLNALTKSKAKVGSFEFTTLEPNLGDFFGFIIADVPGLIEGAAEGKGLGHKFLRHIKRTKMVLHCVSVENEDILNSYKTVRRELENFDKEILKKEEIILLTKGDLAESLEIEQKISQLKTINPNILTVSVFDEDSIKNIQAKLSEYLSN